LLEAMEERQVSVDGQTHPLPDPFFVVATQNPHEQIGTYGLPESQLDRFLMRVSLGYPDGAAERRLLLAVERHELLEGIAAVLTPAEVLAAQRAARAGYVAPPLLDYVQALIARSRSELTLACRHAPRRDWCAPRKPSTAGRRTRRVARTCAGRAAGRGRASPEPRHGADKRWPAPGGRADHRGARAGLNVTLRARIRERTARWARRRQARMPCR
jgi:Mg-chelatase subunit ChlI